MNEAKRRRAMKKQLPPVQTGSVTVYESILDRHPVDRPLVRREGRNAIVMFDLGYGNVIEAKIEGDFLAIRTPEGRLELYPETANRVDVRRGDL